MRRLLFIPIRCLAPAVVALCALGLASGKGEELVAAVSSGIVSIESNFTGTEIVLFGTIERDANTISRRAGYDVVVAARGPEQEIVARRKQRTLGIWVNRESRHYVATPSYLAFLSSKPLPEIASQKTLSGLQLGLDNLILPERGSDSGSSAPGTRTFSNAVIRLMQKRDLYAEDPSGVLFLSPTLFSARIRLPANIPIGTYTAEVYLFGDGALLGRKSIEIDVEKRGLEQLLTYLATQLPLFYGLGAVAMAIFAGWFAGVVFRRD